MSLLTTWEILKELPFEDEFSTSYVTPHIERRETSAFRKCFSVDFLEILEADKIDVSDAEIFNSTLTYSEGDLVVYKNQVYESLQDANTTDVWADEDESFWILVKKFNEGDYNTLWDEGLRQHLAYYIAVPSIKFGTYKMSGKGLTKIIEARNQGTGVNSVDMREFQSVKKELIEISDEALDNARYWLLKWYQDADRTDDEKALFSEVDFINSLSLKKPVYSGRRISFRR